MFVGLVYGNDTCRGAGKITNVTSEASAVVVHLIFQFVVTYEFWVNVVSAFPRVEFGGIVFPSDVVLS